MKDNYTDPTLKHDALFVFDAVDSNPNGDPDNAGKPRTDLASGQGLASDVSLKRKIRDSVTFQVEQGMLPQERYGVFIQRGYSLNGLLEEAYKDEGLVIPKKEDKPNPDDVKTAASHMKKHYFDVRLFGAVMSIGKASAGKVTGPVTVGIARSLDPVLPIELGITRVASTKEEDRDNASQMGNKTVIPYGLYAARVHYQPTVGNTVTEDDLKVLWNTLAMMFEWTRSAARPDINVRGLFVFTHDNALGSAPAHRLLETVKIEKKQGVDIPRGFEDYTIVEPEPTSLPAGITYNRIV
jgi:CRISPR-associated protein Csd2